MIKKCHVHHYLITPKFLDLFRNPKNLGKMEDATVTAVAGNPACGDMITFYLKINEKDVLERASFESYGCAANIATSSIVTEMIKGLTPGGRVERYNVEESHGRDWWLAHS